MKNYAHEDLETRSINVVIDRGTEELRRYSRAAETSRRSEPKRCAEVLAIRSNGGGGVVDFLS